MAQHLRQAPLDAVDEQGDQQDQTDHQALEQAYFTLDAVIFVLHQRLQCRQCLLHLGHAFGGGYGQLLALLDQLTGALQFTGVATYQGIQLTLQLDATVLRLLLLLCLIQT